MAIYRCISQEFWADAKVSDDFTPEDKYFYLYLLTNPYTTISGCYELSFKRASTELGYTADTVERLIDRMENVHGVLRYNKTTKEVLLLNWSKYNWSKSPKLQKAVEASLKDIKSDEFRRWVADMVSIQYQYSMDTTVSVPVSVSVSEKKEEKTKQMGQELDTELADLIQHYQQAIGDFPRSALDALQNWRRVYDKELLILAMDKAAEAGKRSWNYINGILKGWQRDGIKCAGDVAAHEELRNKQQANKPRNKAFMASRPPGEATDWLKDAGKRRIGKKNREETRTEGP